MERVERAVVRECLREVHKELGFKDFFDVAKALIKRDAQISEESALKYLKNQTIGIVIDRISVAALDLLIQSRARVIGIYDRRSETRQYLVALFTKYSTRALELPSPPARQVDLIFDHWKRPFVRGNGVLETGIYQMFRRYKPTVFQLTDKNTLSHHDYRISANHVLIIELIFVDSDSMECLSITSAGKIYHGALFINHEKILYGLLQRPSPTKASVHQRFISMRLEGRLSMYSGLCLKTGDTTHRPIAAECLYVRVPQLNHEQLYEEVLSLRVGGSDKVQLDPGCVAMDYVSNVPPEDHDDADWSRVRYIKDFPMLEQLAEPNANNIIYFREPSRTLNAETLSGLARGAPLRVFQHSRFNTR